MFLDEINTSSCLGLFKEIMVDRTFTGEVKCSLLTFKLFMYIGTSGRDT